MFPGKRELLDDSQHPTSLPSSPTSGSTPGPPSHPPSVPPRYECRILRVQVGAQLHPVEQDVPVPVPSPVHPSRRHPGHVGETGTTGPGPHPSPLSSGTVCVLGTRTDHIRSGPLRRDGPGGRRGPECWVGEVGAGECKLYLRRAALRYSRSDSNETKSRSCRLIVLLSPTVTTGLVTGPGTDGATGGSGLNSRSEKRSTS